ncbi:MAG TPA: MFS transporter [Steroidobacter sp.]
MTVAARESASCTGVQGLGESSGSARDAEYPARAYAWFVMVVFFLAALLSYTDRLILNLLVDPIRQELQITDTGVSLLQGAAFAVLYAMLGLPLGRFADTHSRRNLILCGVLVWSAATAWCGFAGSFTELFIARIGVGMGEAALAPAVLSMLPDYFPPERRATAIGVFLAGMVAGAGTATMVGGVLLDAAQSGHFAFLPIIGSLPPWRAVLALLALPGLLIAALILLVREPVRRERLPGSEHGTSLNVALAYLRRHFSTFALIMSAFALLQVVDYGVNAWLPALLMRRFQMTPAEVGGSVGAIAIGCGVFGALIGGVVADTLQRRGFMDAKVRVAALGAILLIPLLMFPILPSASSVMLLFAAYALVMATLTPAGLAAVQDLAPSELRGLIVALQAFVYTLLGLGCGPTLVAAVTDHVVRDSAKVGVAITIVALPAALLSIVLLWRALPAFRRTRAQLAGVQEGCRLP